MLLCCYVAWEIEPFLEICPIHGYRRIWPSFCIEILGVLSFLCAGPLELPHRLTKSKIKTSKILQLGESDSGTLPIKRTINKNIKKLWPEGLRGKSPIEALLAFLKERNWVGDVTVDASGEIQKLFFAHLGSIYLAQIKHHVALLNATSKQTNGETALRNTLTNVFLYSKAHLCAWNIKHKIKKNCKKTLLLEIQQLYLNKFLSKGSAVIEYLKNSITAKKLAQLPAVQMQHAPAKLPSKIHILVVSLLENGWSNNGSFLGISACQLQEDQFCVAWASHFPQLRNLNTSCVESGHDFINIFISNSSGDFLLVWKSLGHEALHQKIKHHFPQLLLTSKKGSGIQCSHMIGEILKEFGPLESEDFHPQWCLDYNPECSVNNLFLKKNSYLFFSCIQIIPSHFGRHSYCYKVSGTRSQGKNQGNASTQERSVQLNQVLTILSKNIRNQLEKDGKKFVAEEKKRKSESNKVDMEENDKGDQNKMEQNQRNSVCLFKSISIIYSTRMVMKIVDSGAFFQQWNTVKTIGFGCGMNWKKRWVKTSLKFSRINNTIPPLKRLSKMDHRQALANTIHRPVVFLSNSKGHIYLMHVKGDPWVLALLKATDGSKPIPPIIGSTKLASQFTH
ncbi:uncharacterized protein VP01_3661g2 [Puccinia sorghi]|uniref:Uncharacterized protein n=1 Tax=Puccinia sorghi TaxID=27349 RepID=A0A0L6UWC8_9BASI|nr:uncharacterized protein VP01_3661g2 [Puccinia sorghi]